MPTVSPTADCLSPHAYTQQADYDTQYGVYFSSYYVNDISSDYANTSEDGGSFITKEEWELFSSSQWIEAGSITGYLLSYGAWTGSFVGANTCNSSGTCSYQAFTAGSADPTGVHDYEIQYVGNNEWGAYVDLNLINTWSSLSAPQTEENVGIEANDSADTFVNGTSAQAVEYKDANNVWQHWTSPSNLDNNSLGWYSTFTYNAGNDTNEIDYYS